VYTEAKEEDWIPFQTGTVVLTPAMTDRWGTWISALVPIEDPDNGKVIAVLGIDYSASDWYRALWQRMIPDGIVVVSVLILTFALLRIWMLHSALKDQSKKLAYDEALYRHVFSNAPIGIAIVEDKQFVTQSRYSNMNMNPMFERILGRTNQELAKISWLDITYPEDLQMDLEQFAQFKAGKIDGYVLEKRFIRPDGSTIWTNMIISHLSGSPDRRDIHLCLLEDISARKEIEYALRESERSKSVLIANLPGMAYRCRYDEAWTMLFVSDGCMTLTGYSPDSLINNRDISFNELILPQSRDILCDEWRRVLNQREVFRFEYEILTKSGERKWVLETGQGVFGDEGNVQVLEGIIVDITEQRKSQEQITYLQEHDLLTGLINSNHFDKVKNGIDVSDNWPLSLVIIDINGVRMINDAYGHAEGNNLIAVVAKLIQSCCRKDDILARTGGDEFSLLMPRTSSVDANRIAETINDSIDRYNRTITNAHYQVSLCMGQSTKESAGQSFDEVTQMAEYQLKNRKLLNQRSSHNAIVASIMATLYVKSQESEAHCLRLAKLTRMVANELGSSQGVLDDIELFAMLHDIGKIGVDGSILNKAGSLTEEEWAQMKLHSEIGYRIATSTPALEHIAAYILHHHERWDGSGYPSGLKGAEIPLPSRILAVTDAYDAMTETRVYRKALQPSFALEEIENHAGSQFDPDIALLFVRLMRERINKTASTQDEEG
jgi:diguanylate cyclase (GGDEF)-like protein/PAS domain S-box-containing protein